MMILQAYFRPAWWWLILMLYSFDYWWWFCFSKMALTSLSTYTGLPILCVILKFRLWYYTCKVCYFHSHAATSTKCYIKVLHRNFVMPHAGLPLIVITWIDDDILYKILYRWYCHYYFRLYMLMETILWEALKIWEYRTLEIEECRYACTKYGLQSIWVKLLAGND